MEHRKIYNTCTATPYVFSVLCNAAVINCIYICSGISWANEYIFILRHELQRLLTSVVFYTTLGVGNLLDHSVIFQ